MASFMVTEGVETGFESIAVYRGTQTREDERGAVGGFCLAQSRRDGRVFGVDGEVVMRCFVGETLVLCWPAARVVWLTGADANCQVCDPRWLVSTIYWL